MDGSCSKPADNVYLCGYAVELPNSVHEAFSLPYMSAQAAELVALIRACQMFPGETLTVFTDSRYAYGVTHDFGRLWQQRGFKAADGKPISHQTLVSDLLQSITLPARP